jgi:hypothetical protein
VGRPPSPLDTLTHVSEIRSSTVQSSTVQLGHAAREASSSALACALLCAAVIVAADCAFSSRTGVRALAITEAAYGPDHLPSPPSAAVSRRCAQVRNLAANRQVDRTARRWPATLPMSPTGPWPSGRPRSPRSSTRPPRSTSARMRSTGRLAATSCPLRSLGRPVGWPGCGRPPPGWRPTPPPAERATSSARPPPMPPRSPEVASHAR